MTKDEALKMAIEACKEALEQPQQTAKQKYDKFMEGKNESSALERLRFFCAQAMNGQDWLDVEPFLNALKQPAQEPVAWIKEVELGYIKSNIAIGKMDYRTNLGLKPEPDDVPLYTHPAPSWQGLNDDDIKLLKHYAVGDNWDAVYASIKHAENLLKEKNGR